MKYLALYLSFLAVYRAFATDSAIFVQENMCNLAESISRGCSKEIRGPRNVMDCTRLCWRDTDCVGASLDDQGVCLHHQLCHYSVPCPAGSSTSGSHRYMAPYCRHGTWDGSTQSCICHHGTFGERCNEYLKFCDDLLASGYATGAHEVIVDPLEDGINLINAFCWIDRDKNYHNIALFHNWGNNNFNRTWNDYVDGFKDDGVFVWAGLRAMHILGEAGIRNLYLAIRMRDGSDTKAVYENFRIYSEDSGYILDYDFSYSTPTYVEGRYFLIGDCLSPVKHVSFSTWDNDQDGNTRENCASLAGSGWWYDEGCDSPCRLQESREDMDILGVDTAQDPTLIRVIFMYLIKKQQEDNGP